MRDERRILDELEQLGGLLGETRLVREKDRRQAVNRLRFVRHLALGIEICVEMPPGLDPVEDLDTTDLDHAVARGRVQSRGLGIEDDFPHAGKLSLVAETETSENVAHLASVVDRSPPVSMTKSARRRFS